MNALAVEVQSDARELSGRDASWINAILTTWGEWIWENRDFEGYPTSDNVQAFISGAGGSVKGHRIVCRDPPPWVTMTHVLVMMLPEPEGAAVFAEYVPGVAENGCMWTREQKCERLGIGERAMRKRLMNARMKICEWSRRRY